MEEHLLYKVLKLVVNQDLLFTIIENDIITVLVNEGWIIILDDNDMNSSFITEHSKEFINNYELKYK